MTHVPYRRTASIFFVSIPLVIIGAFLGAPRLTEQASAQPPQSVLAFPPTLTPSPIVPTATPEPPTATPEPPTATPVENPTPTPRSGPPRIGIQAGHWKQGELPEELARLRNSTGTFAGGISEVTVNLDIAQRVAALLSAQGFEVDLLPATIPPGYEADAFVSIHADGSTNTKAHGYKLATPWRTSAAAQHLLDTITAEYGSATGLPTDGAITVNMRGYYAFNWRRHEHAVSKATPAVIVEMGFLTNASDRSFMTKRPDTVAAGIANGIIRYLNERDPNDGAALLPPDFKSQRPVDPAGVDIHANPSDGSKVIFHVDGETSLAPIQERDGWFQVIVRGSGGVVGWVRRDLLVETDDPVPTPGPSTAG